MVAVQQLRVDTQKFCRDFVNFKSPQRLIKDKETLFEHGMSNPGVARLVMAEEGKIIFTNQKKQFRFVLVALLTPIRTAIFQAKTRNIEEAFFAKYNQLYPRSKQLREQILLKIEKDIM